MISFISKPDAEVTAYLTVKIFKMASENQLNRWRTRWLDGSFKNWHLNEKSSDLFKYMRLLCPDENDKNGVFLVPMCGKTLDLRILYQEGFNVLGVEFIEEAVQQFFIENAIPYEISSSPSGLTIYSTADKRLRIVCGDFLAVTTDIVGSEPISMVWDRGALGSIDKNLRQGYAKVMKDLLRDSGIRYLLITWQYKDWYRSVPPNNCPLEMLQDLLGDKFDFRELERSTLSSKGLDGDRITYFLTSK